ncbi:MAG: hypothetical protein ACLTKT_08100 [Clostridia bacterium]
MSKYEDLSRLQTLKDSGSLTEAEYEVEKYKILNSTDKQNNKTEGIYIASLVLGICSFLFGAVPFIGLILSIISLVIWNKAKKNLSERNETNGMVTAGVVLSIIGLLAGIFMTIMPLGIMIFNFASSPF